jgi:hypothetical protein
MKAPTIPAFLLLSVLSTGVLANCNTPQPSISYPTGYMDCFNINGRVEKLRCRPDGKWDRLGSCDSRKLLSSQRLLREREQSGAAAAHQAHNLTASVHDHMNRTGYAELLINECAGVVACCSFS